MASCARDAHAVGLRNNDVLGSGSSGLKSTQQFHTQAEILLIGDREGVTESFSGKLGILVGVVDLNQFTLAMHHAKVRSVVTIIQPDGVNWGLDLSKVIAHLPHSFLDQSVNNKYCNFFQNVELHPEGNFPRMIFQVLLKSFGNHNEDKRNYGKKESDFLVGDGTEENDIENCVVYHVRRVSLLPLYFEMSRNRIVS
jgi:hypothetical protein